MDNVSVWYRRDQWALLRQVSVDEDGLPEDYDRWVKAAEHVVEVQRREKGYRTIKALVDVNDLVKWCNEKGMPVSQKAAVQYVTECRIKHNMYLK